MQFNSYIFVLFFLPVTICGYFILNRVNYKVGDVFLLIMSAWFYGAGGIASLLLLGCSICGNYAISWILTKIETKKILLAIGILLNVILLFYFKYFNFAILNINKYANTDFVQKEIILPLGISFFTFQQIAYLVDSYRGETEKNTFGDYLLYVMFFPKLLMGPLVSQRELIPQFRDTSKRKMNPRNLISGIQMFGAGLFKKVLLADTFAATVSWGFNDISACTSIDFFLIMLAYTFQIYFDFSGYSDMAIGIATMLNIELPMNFDSPYKALSIRDFWKRWHISLTKFLTNYLYIPLGGNRKGIMRTYINVMIVFAVSGLWHGANWTFVLWGLLHGAANVGERLLDKQYSKVPSAVRWFITFMIVNVLWLLFRANSVTEWGMILKQMFSFSDMKISNGLLDTFILEEFRVIFTLLHVTYANTLVNAVPMITMFVLGFAICLLFENNYRREKKINSVSAVLTAIVMTWCVVSLGNESVFIYNNF